MVSLFPGQGRDTPRLTKHGLRHVQPHGTVRKLSRACDRSAGCTDGGSSNKKTLSVWEA